MTSASRLIGRGERAPDFALPRDREGPTRFYGLVGGAPAVLLFTGGAIGSGEQRGSDGRATVPELARQLGADPERRLDVYVVARDPQLAGGGGFMDTDGQVHDLFGLSEDDGPVAIVLDTNVRVVAAHRIDELDEPVGSIQAAVPPPPADLGTAPRLAPVLFVPDALDLGRAQHLIEMWSTGGAIETGVETVVQGERAEATDLRVKRRRDLIVEDPALLRELTQHIGRRVMPEVQKAFAFQAGGFEGFKIGCYSAADAGFFEAHRDNLSAGTAHRRFGLTLNLNDDYTGGELRFPEYGPTRYRPAAGEALIFSGSHLHEVLPVETGRRFVLLSFLLARRTRPA